MSTNIEDIIVEKTDSSTLDEIELNKIWGEKMVTFVKHLEPINVYTSGKFKKIWDEYCGKMISLNKYYIISSHPINLLTMLGLMFQIMIKFMKLILNEAGFGNSDNLTTKESIEIALQYVEYNRRRVENLYGTDITVIQFHKLFPNNVYSRYLSRLDSNIYKSFIYIFDTKELLVEDMQKSAMFTFPFVINQKYFEECWGKNCIKPTFQYPEEIECSEVKRQFAICMVFENKETENLFGTYKKIEDEYEFGYSVKDIPL